MRIKTVVATSHLDTSTRGPGFKVQSLRAQMGSLDPFVSLDEFHMSQPTFPPHPHAGFSAVTYMFEDSAGAFINRDSLGDRSLIGPGAFHWTQAARGVVHEEVPEHPGTDCHGVQMFVNLAAAHKDAPPRMLHLDRERIPELRQGQGVRVRVLAGESNGVRSPLELLTPVTLLDVHLEPGASFEHAVPAGHRSFVLPIRGAGFAGPDEEAVSLAHGLAAAFEDQGEVLRLRAGTEPLHALVGTGRPLREPLVAGGPFLMNTQEQITDAFRRFQAGGMGRLESA
jgi:redox-sensitive bicupin YhaK (pirin superfamily)